MRSKGFPELECLTRLCLRPTRRVYSINIAEELAALIDAYQPTVK